MGHVVLPTEPSFIPHALFSIHHAPFSIVHSLPFWGKGFRKEDNRDRGKKICTFQIDVYVQLVPRSWPVYIICDVHVPRG